MRLQTNELPIRVRRSKIQGRGVFATRRIRKGTRIIEYVGERITSFEENRRYPENEMTSHHTFLFGVGENNTIDGGRFGNDSRFINHSCDPNCEAVDHDGRIFIEARRTILAGEELSYDYSFEVSGRVTKALKEFYACCCGTESCRETILKLPTRKRRKRAA